MSLDFGVMPNLEWTALSVEPGCRQAAMDPQIKLFGRILSVTPSHIGAGADAGVLINPTSVSPPSRQDGGDSVHRGAENKGVSEKLVSARSSSGNEFLLLFKKVNESCGGAAAAPLPQQQQQQQLCEESESAQSDELRDHSSTHSGGNNNNNIDGKKPDKVVACPRCNSQETKFCYYNNYNVNQPRHFCKNCQRYWTAGGTLRNVPVGAGRRKNKTGSAQQQQQRENDASPNCSSFQVDSSEFSCGLSSPGASKLSHPKRLSGQGSPLRSPGSTSPFGPDSVIAMSSPMYSLCQNGRLPFQSFNSCTQGFTTSGVEMSAVGSSDSAPALRGQRLVCLPSPAGFDKDGTRPSFSEQVQGAANLNTVRFFNGEWPHGYTHDWDGNHHPHQISQGFTPVLTTYNTATTTPTPTPTPPSSWSPAWMGDPQWPPNQQQPLQFTLGKRHRDTVNDMVPSKSPRTENAESRTDVRSKWPMLPGRNLTLELQQSRGTLKQLLHHPKVEPSNAACDPKDTFFSRMFKSTTAPRLVPFPVTT